MTTEPMRFAKDGWTFAQVPIALIMDSDISDGAKTLFSYLVWRQGTNAGCWPSVTRTAADLSVSRSTVLRRQEELESAGYLSIERRPGRSNMYHAHAAPVSSAARRGVKNDTTTSVNSDTHNDSHLNDIDDNDGPGDGFVSEMTRVGELWVSIFGLPQTDLDRQQMDDRLEDYGGERVFHALEVVYRQAKAKWSLAYLDGVLNNNLAKQQPKKGYSQGPRQSKRPIRPVPGETRPLRPEDLSAEDRAMAQAAADRSGITLQEQLNQAFAVRHKPSW